MKIKINFGSLITKVVKIIFFILMLVCAVMFCIMCIQKDFEMALSYIAGCFVFAYITNYMR
jgi:hypothetical protein